MPGVGDPMTMLAVLCDEWEELPEHRGDLERQREDDGVQLRDPHYAGGANEPSLRVARANFQLFGASERRFLGSVRPPRHEERASS